MYRLKTGDIRDWLKNGLGDLFQTYYINKVNKNKQPNNKLGVYYTKNSLPHIFECLGGYETDRTDYFTLLIIGTDNYEESREKGEEVFEWLLNENLKNPLIINNKRINRLELMTQLEDVSDFDTEGFYEFVINLKVEYNIEPTE